MLDLSIFIEPYSNVGSFNFRGRFIEQYGRNMEGRFKWMLDLSIFIEPYS
jgi:hypothetical protein